MSPSKVIARYGPSRGGVRVILTDDEESVIVKWRAQGERRQRSWPNTPAGRTEAKAWALGFAEELAQHRAPVPVQSTPLTLAELWERYTTAVWQDLRPNSRRLYTEHWRYWVAFANPDFVAEKVTPEMIDDYRKNRLAKPLSVLTVNESIRTLKRVFTWADSRELLARNRVSSYRVKTPKDQRTESPPEYSPEEYKALVNALDPAKLTQWRAWVALTICGEQGVRSHAALHLRWADVQLRGRSIVWRAPWDKTGKEWVQALRRGTVRALRVARDRAKADGYRGGWVLYVGSRKTKRETYSPQSLWRALREAEKRAGIPHRERRAAHGLRRLLAGEVNALTGNPVLAMRSIGDTDVRQASRYLKDREQEQRAAFRALDRRGSEPSESTGNEATTESETVGVKPLKPSAP